jgi:hypothetical protein
MLEIRAKFSPIKFSKCFKKEQYNVNKTNISYLYVFEQQNTTLT